MSELQALLGAFPQITGPLSLIAFLGIIFYLMYRRSVNTGRGLEFAYEYLKSVSPQLKKQDFFRITLVFFLLILVFIFLLFLLLLELSDLSLYLYLGLFVVIFMSFLFFAFRLSLDTVGNSRASVSKRRNNMQKLDKSGKSNENLSTSNIDSLMKQKASLEKSVDRLEEKKSMYGMDVPLNLLNEIDYVKEQLQAVNDAIKDQMGK